MNRLYWCILMYCLYYQYSLIFFLQDFNQLQIKTIVCEYSLIMKIIRILVVGWFHIYCLSSFWVFYFFTNLLRPLHIRGLIEIYWQECLMDLIATFTWIKRKKPQSLLHVWGLRVQGSALYVTAYFTGSSEESASMAVFLGRNIILLEARR